LCLAARWGSACAWCEGNGAEWSEMIRDESGHWRAATFAKCRELARWLVHAKRPEAKARASTTHGSWRFVVRSC
jgi:hypothetical protein